MSTSVEEDTEPTDENVERGRNNLNEDTPAERTMFGMNYVLKREPATETYVVDFNDELLGDVNEEHDLHYDGSQGRTEHDSLGKSEILDGISKTSFKHNENKHNNKVDRQFELHTKQPSSRSERCTEELKQILVDDKKSVKRTINKYFCEICQKGYVHKCRLVQHIMIHTGKRSYECQLCLKKFTHKRYLALHWTIHMRKKKFKCEICMKSFCSMKNLKQHVHSHMGVRFDCKMCPKTYLSVDAIRRHEKNCHRSHVSDVKKERDSSREWTHRRTEQNDPARQLKSQNKHTETDRKQNEKYNCKEDRKLESDTILVQQNSTHGCDSEKERHSEDFITEKRLNECEQTDSVTKRYYCDLCDRVFTRKHHLVSHIRCVHSNERPYKCIKCSKRYKLKAQLDTHYNSIHVGVKHSCAICHKELAYKANLYGHMKLHNGK